MSCDDELSARALPTDSDLRLALGNVDAVDPGRIEALNQVRRTGELAPRTDGRARRNHRQKNHHRRNDGQDTQLLVTHVHNP